MFAASLLSVLMVGGVPAVQPAATVFETAVICREPGRYIGWPTLLRRKDGELIAVFSGDRIWHVCPFGKVQAVRSRDGGRSWSAPETWIDGPLDDRDAGLVELADGTLVLNWFTSVFFKNVGVADWKSAYGKIPAEILRNELGFFTMRSTDGGRTWTDRVRTEGTVPHGGVRLADGRLAMATTVKDADDKPAGIQMEVSSDGARSWQVVSKVPFPLEVSPTRFCEPHLAELPDGRLLVLVRDEATGNPVWQTTSTDGGRTWSVLRKSGFDGLPPFLTVLQDGRLLCSYASRKPGSCGIRARVSADGGETWNAAGEIRLAACLESDLGYPSTVEFPDGTLYTVYYMRDRLGEGTCLMGTRWKLEENAVSALPPDEPKRVFVLSDGTTVGGCRVRKPVPAFFGTADVEVVEWDDFAPGSAAFVADSAAADGVAFHDPLRPLTYPLHLAVSSRKTGATVERQVSADEATAAGDGFRIWRIGTARIQGWAIVVLNASWRFYAELPEGNGTEREVWVSMRLKDGRALFDRLFLVKARFQEGK